MNRLIFPVLLSGLCILSAGAQHKFASLQKTGCLGVCPVYTLDIYPNGKVILQAEKFVATGSGTFRARLPRRERKALQSQFEQLDFFRFDNRYAIPASDLPGTFLYFNNGKQEKTIELYGAGPEALHRLAGRLHAMVGRLRWKRVKVK